MRFSMESINLNKSRLREIMQWVNIIFKRKEKTSQKMVAIFIREITVAV